jgi:hydroxyethylthiazole kinase-like sugar kinase family protein
VDSTQGSGSALPFAKAIATQTGCIVAISGKTDYVSGMFC